MDSEKRTWGEFFLLFFIVYAAVFLLGLLVYLFYRRWRNKLLFYEWAGKSVLVTGCDRGFGHDLVLELDRLGCIVYAGCHSQRGVIKLKPLVSNRVRLLEIEITSAESIAKVKEFIEKDLPDGVELWGLVNNAGIVRGMVFDFAKEEDYREVFNVNFYGTIAVTEAFLPLIKKSKGRVVNVVSIMGRCAVAAGPYSCSKFAMEAYSDGLRRSLRAFGVHVSILEPGFFKTGMTDPSFWSQEIDRLWDKMPTHLKEDYGEDFRYKAKDAYVSFIDKPPFSAFNTLELVVEDMVHSLQAMRPKARYVSGLDGHLMYRTTALLPDWVLDYFIWNYFVPYPDLERKINRVKQH